MRIVKKFLSKLVLRLFGVNIQLQLELIYSFYHVSINWGGKTPLQVYSLDGRAFFACGFADRLRGIISTYAYAKANNLPFRIDHRLPFQLEDYLTPNEIDWRIHDDELSYNILYANPIVMLDYTRGERLLKLCRKRQHHYYLNINVIPLINKHYGTCYTYNQLYNELFKPSDMLVEAMRPFNKYIQEGYISISFRFLQLMGDFVDVCGDTLSESEQQILVTKCMDFIGRIHDQHPETRNVLVTTDSIKFAEKVRIIPYVFVIPGKIGHIAYQSDSDINLKMILDFYMISKAKKAYLGYTGDMYKSHFAQSAAEISGIPYESINF